MYISIQQACYLFDELKIAYEDKHGFGRDTAEIYAYTLMPRDPSGRKDIADQINAARSLYDIISIFRKRYDDAIVMIDDIDAFSWLQNIELGKITFDHRVHVKVLKNG